MSCNIIEAVADGSIYLHFAADDKSVCIFLFCSPLN